ncbi:MAG: DUF2971 domain-containing protein [Chitinophagales bacterium]
MNIEEIDKEIYNTIIKPTIGKSFKCPTLICSGTSGNEIQINYGLSPLRGDEKFKPKEDTFIHFTSLKVLHSILNEGCIRLYNIARMNDTKEVDFVAKKFRIDQQEINKFKENAYIMSNCCSTILNTSDELMLWRLYGNDGLGCCIEFEYTNDINIYRLHRYNVNYIDENNQEIDNLINKLIEFNKKIEPYTINLKQFILNLAVFFKSKQFKSEKEQRLYIEIIKNCDNDKVFHDVNSKNNNTSYIEIPLSNSKNANQLNDFNVNEKIRIKRIIFGHKNIKNKMNDMQKFKFLTNFFIDFTQMPKIEYSNIDFYN